MESTDPKQPAADLGLTGFEQIFVHVVTEDVHEKSANNHELSENTNEHSLNNLEQIHDAQSIEAEAFELVTMAAAARRLNMPYPTLRRHVLNGKIQSVIGEDGKPLVKLNSHEHSPTTSEHSPTTSEYSANSNDQIVLSSEFSANIQTLLAELKSERDYSRGLAAKLEAASHRNGYLEALTEQQGGQLKLLTDSQHKVGWWRGFCSWFTGAS